MTSPARTRSDAVRERLIEYVGAHPARTRKRLWVPALLIVGALLVGGVTTSAFAASGLLSPGPAQPAG